MRRPPVAEWSAICKRGPSAKVPLTPQFARWGCFALANHSDPAVRLSCACYLADCRLKPRLVHKIVNAFLTRALDLSEHPRVRGQCLESLVWHVFIEVPPGRQGARVRKVILQCLRDHDANVRFWACYAVSVLNLHEAASDLRRLREDPAVAIMGWSVGYEATEALKVLDGLEGWAEDRLPEPSPYPDLWRD